MLLTCYRDEQVIGVNTQMFTNVHWDALVQGIML